VATAHGGGGVDDDDRACRVASDMAPGEAAKRVAVCGGCPEGSVLAGLSCRRWRRGIIQIHRFGPVPIFYFW